MGEVTVQSHNVSLASYRHTNFQFNYLYILSKENIYKNSSKIRQLYYRFSVLTLIFLDMTTRVSLKEIMLKSSIDSYMNWYIRVILHERHGVWNYDNTTVC